MADINSLVSTKLSKLSEENISLAAEKCSQADQCILDTRESGGRDPGLVKQAVELYQESLQLNSKQVQPYIGLAYISYSTGDIKTAIGLLNKAYDLEPLNEKVNEMLSLFNDEHKQKNISGAISKIAGKSLSEKLNSGEKKAIEFNFFDKITSIFVKSTRKKSAANADPFMQTANYEELTTTKNRTVPGNFLEEIRNLKK
jgi:tetratricopeptide (TPR) repeat protein